MLDHYGNDNSDEIARLRALEITPSREPQTVEQGRARFLAEARRLGQAVSPSPVRRLKGWIEQLGEKEISIMNRRLASASTLLVAAVLLTLLLGGTVATAYAAQGALPGTALHPIKTGLERARLALSLDPASDARLNLHFAEARLEEMEGLIDAGRFSELPDVAAAFEAHIQAAIQGLSTVAHHHPDEAQHLAQAIMEALSRYASLLADLSASVPGESQGPLLQALETSSQGVEI